MKRILVLSLCGLVLGGIGLLVGCGDDDNATGPSWQTGEPDDPEYVTAQQIIEEDMFIGATGFPIMMLTGPMIDMVFDSAAGEMSAREPGGDLALQSLMSLTYHPDSKYWYTYAGAPVSGGIVTAVDSVQFLHASGPVQWPDSALVVGIKTGVLFIMSSDQETFLIGQQLSMMGDVVSAGDVEINGSMLLNYPLQSMATKQSLECFGEVSASWQLEDVTANLNELSWGGACPSGGSIDCQLTLRAICVADSLFPVDGDWRLVQTFAEGEVTTIYEHNLTRWTETDSCEVAAVSELLQEALRLER